MRKVLQESFITNSVGLIKSDPFNVIYIGY